MNLLDELEGEFNLCAMRSDGSLYRYDVSETVNSRHAPSQEIMNWCYEHEIDADLLRRNYPISEGDTTRSVWGIKNETHRTMFALRWS